MKKLCTALVFCVLACAAVGCSVDSAPAQASEDAPASVVRESERLTIQSGDDKVVTTIHDTSHTIEYFEGNTWLATAKFDSSTRSLTVHAPGFDKNIDIAVGAEERATAIPGISEEERARYLGRATAVATRLANNPNVAREMSASHSGGATLAPRAKWTCAGPSGLEWILSPIYGYWLAYNCL